MSRHLIRRHPLRFVLAALAGLLLALTGCATLDEKQREWIFQPSTRSWPGGAASAEGMSEVWIEFEAKASEDGTDAPAPVKLHGLWLAQPHADAPVLLYLHGARSASHCHAACASASALASDGRPGVLWPKPR